MHIWIPGVDDIKEDLAQYADAKHERKPHGIVFVNGQEVATTLMCPHCGAHFVSRRGSGHRRSFCLKCMDPCCDKPGCNPNTFHDLNKPYVEDVGLYQGKR